MNQNRLTGQKGRAVKKFSLLLAYLILIAVCTFIGPQRIIAPAQTDDIAREIQNTEAIMAEITTTDLTEPADEVAEVIELEAPSEEIDAEIINVASDDVLPFTMENSLIIGDSRVTGLRDFSGLEGVDYFADIGMNVYVVCKKELPVGDMGDISLEALLTAKTYDKIYTMLGINEVGYNYAVTARKYGELITLIKAHQPDAEIFVMANLHVTEEHALNSKYTTNEAIDDLNEHIYRVSVDERCHYLDANTYFDDENGFLPEEKAEDGMHLFPSQYVLWGQWISDMSQQIISPKQVSDH